MMSARSWADIVAERIPLADAGEGAPMPLCWFYDAVNGGCDRGARCQFWHPDPAPHLSPQQRRAAQLGHFHALRRMRRARDCDDERACWAWALGEAYPYKPHAVQRSLFPLPEGCALPCYSYANTGRCARGDACPWPHFTAPRPLVWREKRRSGVPHQRTQAALL